MDSIQQDTDIIVCYIDGLDFMPITYGNQYREKIARELKETFPGQTTIVLDSKCRLELIERTYND